MRFALLRQSQRDLFRLNVVIVNVRDESMGGRDVVGYCDEYSAITFGAKAEIDGSVGILSRSCHWYLQNVDDNSKCIFMKTFEFLRICKDNSAFTLGAEAEVDDSFAKVNK